MKTEKRAAATRRCRIEYPVFSDGETDVSLMNLFSEKLSGSVLRKSEEHPGYRFRMTYAASEVKDGVDLTFRIEVTEARTVLRAAKLRIIWKRGFIKKLDCRY